MEQLKQFAQQFCKESEFGWTLQGRQLVVPVGANGRKQKIQLGKKTPNYILTTTIANAETVTTSNRKWRELARLTWKRNSETDLVNFTFDEDNRLIGSVVHPDEHLDYEEFVVYVKSLAAESDRFEYLLTGKDRW